MTELATENRKLKAEIAKIRQSEAFRIGKRIVFLPGAVKRRLLKFLKKSEGRSK
jgi:L-lysine 2,3-aminomutase